jgi:hypothetical protein
MEAGHDQHTHVETHFSPPRRGRLFLPETPMEKARQVGWARSGLVYVASRFMTSALVGPPGQGAQPARFGGRDRASTRSSSGTNLVSGPLSTPAKLTQPAIVTACSLNSRS